MMTKIVAKGTLAFSLLGLVLATARCDEPPPACAAARTPFIGAFTQTGGSDPSCAKNFGEEFSISTYNAIGPDLNKPNLYVSSIAIGPSTLIGLVDTASGEGAADPDKTHTPYSLGFFDSGTPGDDQFCHVPTLTSTIQNIPGYPADPDNDITDPVAATSISYVWSNVRFFVTAEYLGNQFSADVVKTVDGVACNYHVEGLATYTPCGIPDPNDPTGVNTIPSDILCGHNPAPQYTDPLLGVPFQGSQINPDFPVHCDTNLQVCVLSKPVPALN